MSLSEEMINALPGLILDEREPVFNEPWEAEAFALTIALHARGHFTWSEWAETLGAVIADLPRETAYYQAWLSALERIMVTKGVVSDEILSDRKDAWDRAARATPHGEAIELGAETRTHALAQTV